jgi:4-diphosphocytidyl-2-C-methyl-D-erythritol kinase
MIVFPNSKINLGLRILRQRSDGHHDLETVFYPVALTDILEITTYKEYERTLAIPFTTSGLPIETEIINNLCTKAYKLLKKDFHELPHVQMHLHKVIPLGAGLGGGSADAAFTLRLLNKKFDLGLSDKQLIDYAFQLGSDCPFFIINKPCFATGSGEVLEEINMDLSSYKIMIVNPGIHINTGLAFRSIKPSVPKRSVKEIIAGPMEKWKDELKNDFEIFAFKKYPEIVNIKDQLYVAGAVYASLSGSGSTVYGFFPKQKKLQLTFPSQYMVWELAC